MLKLELEPFGLDVLAVRVNVNHIHVSSVKTTIPP
jgi:hypothetical protein